MTISRAGTTCLIKTISDLAEDARDAEKYRAEQTFVRLHINSFALSRGVLAREPRRIAEGDSRSRRSFRSFQAYFILPSY